MGDNTINDGPSHGFSLSGNGVSGDHSGGGADLTYELGVPLLSGDHRLFLDPKLGFGIGGYSKNYATPGGEAANSSFTRFGGRIGVGLRYAPPILDHRLWASLGVGLGLFGFSTPDSTKVSTPGNCTPGDFGRADCEPKAGALSGNAGTTGLLNPRVGSSRSTTGMGLIFDAPLTIGVDVLRGAWGNAGLFGYVGPQFVSTSPKDGDSNSQWGVMGGGGLIVRFGGSAVEKPKTEKSAPALETEQMVEATSSTVAGSDAVDPVFEADIRGEKGATLFGTLSGTMTGPDGKPASFEFVEKEVKGPFPKLKVKITQKPLTPGVYTLNYTITNADKTKQAKGVAKFTVSSQPTLKLEKFSVSPAEFYAGNKSVKIRMETSLKDSDKIKKLTLTFKKKKDDKDEIGTDVAIPPKVFESLTVGSKGILELDKLDLSALEGNSAYIITATVEGQDGQIKQIGTSVNVKPKANLEVNGLGSSYAPGAKLPPLELKLSGVEKVKVRVTVTTTIPGTPTKDQPTPPDVVIVDSQVIDVAAAKAEKIALRCQTADKKTVMIGEGGSNPKTGNYSVTFEAVNEKGDVIQHLIEPRAFSVAPTPPPPPKPGVYKAPKKSGS